MKDEKEAQLRATILELKDLGVKIVTHNGPNRQNFGNWLVIGLYHYVAVRFVCDRDLIGLNLMPAAQFKPAPFTPDEANPESDWYTWDVVASAANVPFRVEIPPLDWFLSYRDGVNRAFAPENWEHTRQRLADFEEEKRRRFTQGRNVPAREPVHH